MSSTTTLIQAVLSMTVYLALFGGVALFFRPLLVGIGRALYLTVRPRRSKAPGKPAAIDAAKASLMELHR